MSMQVGGGDGGHGGDAHTESSAGAGDGYHAVGGAGGRGGDVHIHLHHATDTAAYHTRSGSLAGQSLANSDINPTTSTSIVPSDLGSVLLIIKDAMATIRNQSEADKERQEQARLALYHTLSIHPALDHMHPRGEIGDLDWYTELRSPFLSMNGIFGRFRQNESFQRTSLLGESGTRARIMLLLCWVIGHRLPLDRINQLLSTAIEDALKSAIPHANGSDIQNLTQLWHVKRELESISRMIRTHLPLPPDRNPFYGRRYTKEDEDKQLPRGELWGHSLPEEQKYEFDIKQNPSILLRHQSRVLIPSTKLSLLAIQWASCIFSLGRKVHSMEEIDPTAFWNADPPASTPPMLQFEDMESACSDDDQHGTSDYITLEEAWEDLPLDDWIHERFCYVYLTHGWAHERITRILLFSMFCHHQHLPDMEDVFSMFSISRCLRSELGYDVCMMIADFLIIEGLYEWAAINKGQLEHTLDFTTMSKEERGMSVIFVDAHELQFKASYTLPTTQDFHIATLFLTHPEIDCPGEPDVLGIPTLFHRQNIVYFQIPEMSDTACSCGHCPHIHQSLIHSSKDFQVVYFSFIDHESPGKEYCSTLEETWGPLFRKAEAWIDSFMDRIEVPFNPFPNISKHQLGPSILTALQILRLEIGAHLTTKQLLHFFSLVCFLHMHPDFLPSSLLLHETDTFAFLASNGPDGEILPDQAENVMLSTAGGWLYDAVTGFGLRDENSQITLLQSSAALSIRVHCTVYDGVIAVNMPMKQARAPIVLPHAHDALDAPEAETPSSNASSTPSIMLDIGRYGTHGFPLSLAKGSATEVLAAQISTMYHGRIIQTLWQPEVWIGRPCEHTDMYHRMTHCSLTSHEVLLQVKPTQASLLPLLSPGSRCNARHGDTCRNEHDDLFFEEQKRTTSHLTARGGPFDPSKFCIVRCGDAEGPVDPIILLSGSLGRKVYILDYQECWACACSRMRGEGLGLGIAFGTRVVTKCAYCLVDERRARRIAHQNDAEIRSQLVSILPV